MTCRMCGKENVTVQVVQEQTGSTTHTFTISKYKEKGHSCLWWLLVGWWWWIVDLLLWITMFLPRLVMRLFAAPFKKKKYEGSSVATSDTKNTISYKKIFVCPDCGYSWKEDA